MNGNYITAAALAIIALSKRHGSMGRKPTNWTADMISVLGTAPDTQVAAALGLSIYTVRNKRIELGIDLYRKTPVESNTSTRVPGEYTVERKTRRKRRAHGQMANREWIQEEIDLLGEFPDWEIARLLDIHEYYVADKRKEFGIDAFPIEEYRRNIERYNWTPEKIAQLGTMTDRDLSNLWGDIHYASIAHKRINLGIEPFGIKPTQYKDVDISMLTPQMFETKKDIEVHRETGVPLFAVKRYREELGIEDYRVKRARFINESLNDLSRYLGKLPDRFLAEKYNIPLLFIMKKRKDMGILSPRETYPYYLTNYLIDMLNPNILNAFGNMSDMMIYHKFGFPVSTSLMLRRGMEIPEYQRPIYQNRKFSEGWNPEEILLFMTKSDEWNSEAFAIPLWVAKALRIHFMETMNCYPQGLTKEHKDMVFNKLYKQMNDAR